MFICIKSEIDSRPLLYPLMRALWNYGSLLVITSNRQVQRLIDDQETRSFRNATVVVDVDGATDDILNDYGYAPSDFDFVISDNMGVTDCDVLLIPTGAKQSIEFAESIDMLLDKSEKQKIFMVQFGKAPQKEKPERAPREDRKKRPERDKKQKEDVLPEDYDPAAKFRAMAEDKKQQIRKVTSVTVPFPSLQDIEYVEAEHRFYEVPDAMVKLIYSAVSEKIGVEPNMFRKEMRRKDENRGRVTAELNRK